MKFEDMQVTFSSGDNTWGPYKVPSDEYFPCVLVCWSDTLISVGTWKRKFAKVDLGEKLYQDRKFTDAVINCGDQQFHVHRAVLAGASPVFDSMFGGGMLEAQKATVEIQDAPPAAVEILIKYIYTAILPDVGHLDKLFVLANKYMMPQLALEVGQQMLQDFDKANGNDYLRAVRCYAAIGDVDAKNLWEQLISRLHENRELMQAVVEALIERPAVNSVPEPGLCQRASHSVTV